MSDGPGATPEREPVARAAGPLPAPVRASADVFRLRGATPAAWADAVAAEPVALLSDHAHCELKAAANAMTMLKRNPDRPGVALRLAPLIKEETDHLHRVLRELDARGAALGHDLPNPYAEGLHRIARETTRAGQGWLDVLLVSALIEMRSHERFDALLACAALADLHPLYGNLCEAEARHGELFTGLALDTHPPDLVAERFDVLADAEAELLAELPFGYRVHSGLVEIPRA